MDLINCQKIVFLDTFISLAKKFNIWLVFYLIIIHNNIHFENKMKLLTCQKKRGGYKDGFF